MNPPHDGEPGENMPADMPREIDISGWTKLGYNKDGAVFFRGLITGLPEVDAEEPPNPIADIHKAWKAMRADYGAAPSPPPSPQEIRANILKAQRLIEQATTTIACHPDDQAALEAEISKRRAAGEILLVDVVPTWWVPGEYVVVPKTTLGETT